jgi:hypothetical protein
MHGSVLPARGKGYAGRRHQHDLNNNKNRSLFVNRTAVFIKAMPITG